MHARELRPRMNSGCVMTVAFTKGQLDLMRLAASQCFPEGRTRASVIRKGALEFSRNLVESKLASLKAEIEAVTAEIERYKSAQGSVA